MLVFCILSPSCPLFDSIAEARAAKITLFIQGFPSLFVLQDSCKSCVGARSPKAPKEPSCPSLRRSTYLRILHAARELGTVDLFVVEPERRQKMTLFAGAEAPRSKVRASYVSCLLERKLAARGVHEVDIVSLVVNRASRERCTSPQETFLWWGELARSTEGVLLGFSRY